MKYQIVQTMGGATPLMYACQQCREHEVVDILMKKPQSVKERDRTLKTPLHYCAENVNVNCAELLLKAAPELVNVQDENGYCPLHLAVIAGNRGLIKLLIAKGADVNLCDGEGHSSVHWAIVSSEKEALDIIIEAGADPSTPDIHGGFPIHYAVQMCGSTNESSKSLSEAIKVVHRLLRQNVNVNVLDKDERQPILWAASAGSAQIIKDLINRGSRVDSADKDGLTGLGEIFYSGGAIAYCKEPIILYGIALCSTALHCAASRGHTGTIETLIESCGAEVDVIDGNGCSALFYAVTLGHADATAILLKLGAEPNRQDRKGRTPAHCGAAKGQLETLRILEKYGGNMWLRNVKGDFPFHEAIASGRRELVLWFLQQNPEAINIGNNDGRCPLHVAAMYNHVDVLKLLLENKCLVNPVMRSSRGILMTPLNVALHKGHRSCGKFLQLHGGIPFSKVSKPDTVFVNSVRVSPFKNRLNKESHWSEDIISPSFTVINTSNDADQTKIQNEKKKVFRRRKKRKNHSNGKRFDSDSEDSIEDDRNKIQSHGIVRRLRNDERDDDDDGNGKNQLKEKSGNAAITSVILINDDDDDDDYHSKNNNYSLLDTKQEVTKNEIGPEVAPIKTSLPEPKTLSTISPDSFPPTMQAIIHLDSEIQLDSAETELEETKSPNEIINGVQNTLGMPQIGSISGTSDSLKDDLLDNDGRVNGNKESNGNEISNFITPSFTVLDDEIERENSKSETHFSSKEIMKEETKTSPKAPLDSTKANHMNTLNGKKNEKTKNSTKKDNKSESEDCLSSGSSSKRGEKGGRTNKGKHSSSNGSKFLKNYKSKEPDSGEKSVERTKEPAATASKSEVAGKFPVPLAHSETAVIENSMETFNHSSKTPINEKSEENTKSDENPEEIKGPEKEISPKQVQADEKDDQENLKTAIDVPLTHPDEVLPFGNAESVAATNSVENIAVTVPIAEEKHEEPAPNEEDKPTDTPKNRTAEKLENLFVSDTETVETAGASKETEDSPVEPSNPVTVSGNIKSSQENAAPEPPETPETGEEIKELSHVYGTPTKTQTPVECDQDLENNGADRSGTIPHSSPSHSNEKYGATKRGSHHYILTSQDAEEPERSNENRIIEVIDTEPVDEPEGFNTEDDGLHQREKSPDGDWTAHEQGSKRVSRVSRLCRRNKNLRDINQVSVNQLVQGTIRKYHLERGIFHQLLELKRLQIRAGRANEQVLVKRLVDEYDRSCASIGMKHYTGVYRFKDFEKFLYDQLKALNRGHLVLPEMKSYDDIDALSGILKKSRFKILNEAPPYELPYEPSYESLNEPQCACLTQRCHHSTRAYTTLPCSAYVANIRRNKTPKPKKESFLPQIYQYKTDGEKCTPRPTTLELIQGDKKQVIELPPTRPDKSKKYYITFTIKSASNLLDEHDYQDNDIKNRFKHRHAKSV